jgi:chitin synthase
MAIVATMYNEGAQLFDNSMRAIIKNIQHLQSRVKSKTWGDKAWEKVVVVIVAESVSPLRW